MASGHPVLVVGGQQLTFLVTTPRGRAVLALLSVDVSLRTRGYPALPASLGPAVVYSRYSYSEPWLVYNGALRCLSGPSS